MKIRKSIQKLMPSGCELILQGDIKLECDVKLSIRKRFDTKFELDDYVNANAARIKKAMALIERAVSVDNRRA